MPFVRSSTADHRWRRRLLLAALSLIVVPPVIIVGTSAANAAPPASRVSAPTPAAEPTKAKTRSSVGSPIQLKSPTPDIVTPNAPCLDCDPEPAPCFPEWEECESFFIVCTPRISETITRNETVGASSSRVSWNASWSCTNNYYAAHATIIARTLLVDRSADHDDEVLAAGPLLTGTDRLTLTGAVTLPDELYPRAQQIEVILHTTLHITGVHQDNVWEYCGPLETLGLRWVEPCQGLGTQTMLSVIGSNEFDSLIKRPFRYVALGDSYASGLGAGDYYEGSPSSGCAKSRRSYAKLLEQSLVPVLAPQGKSMFMTQPACQGAVTGDVLANQLGVFNGEAGAQTDWVTLSIGGNDVGFGSMIQDCITGDCSGLVITPAQLSALSSSVRQVYSRVRQLTPNARRTVVLYPQILPATVTLTCPVGISQAEADAIRTAWATVNVTIANAATFEGWQVLSSSANGFDGHSVCDSQPFANGIVITAPRESYHPNAAGHAWLGGVLASSGLIPL
jgi:hypothetical protein